jgi:hypothetical protein
MKSIPCLLCIVFCTLIFGCSGGKQPLSGRVTYSDGSPLETGTVCFEDGSFLARGDIKEDGRYKVGSEKTDNGIPPGTYNVYIIGAEKVPEGRLGLPTPLIDKKYAHGATSGLTFTADGKSRECNLTVEHFGGK